MSVWESLDAVVAFVFGGFHAEVLRRRRQWLSRLQTPSTVAWWVRAGTRPTVADAEQRLAQLHASGPTPEAFTLRRSFAPSCDIGAPGSRIAGPAPSEPVPRGRAHDDLAVRHHEPVPRRPIHYPNRDPYGRVALKVRPPRRLPVRLHPVGYTREFRGAFVPAADAPAELKPVRHERRT